MKNESISRVMTASPMTVSPSDKVSVAERIMRETGAHHVPVVDEDGKVIGMLGFQDLLRALVLESDPERPLKQGALSGISVDQVMQRKVVTLPQTATLLDAARGLTKGNFHAIPVVAPGGVLAGIVTSSDLIASLADAVEHPVAEESAVDSERAGDSDEQVRLLRQVYRATLHYLESGRGDIEHARLLRAVASARERIVPGDLPI
jgi:CBS domain-containing membrane protein